ncbi:hypothetical protein [Nocardioides sp. GXZ039]|uniref:hypothetical protein n=1 Tax=Nocardioides sp. GXZ039 TaxID=3136018 RepID=UPI0030F4B38E
MSVAPGGSAGRRIPCDPCKETHHTAADCADRIRPMCQRTCPCGHGAADRDPSPFWTAVRASETDAAARESVAAGEESSGSLVDHAGATNGRWRLSPPEQSATKGEVQ